METGKLVDVHFSPETSLVCWAWSYCSTSKSLYSPSWEIATNIHYVTIIQTHLPKYASNELFLIIGYLLLLLTQTKQSDYKAINAVLYSSYFVGCLQEQDWNLLENIECTWKLFMKNQFMEKYLYRIN